jgi:starch phosphorylase
MCSIQTTAHRREKAEAEAAVFLASASLKDLLRGYRHMYTVKELEQFVERTSIQLNDTHPVVAIPEFIRLLMEDDIEFEDAFRMAGDIFNYTNHTVMSEALERWDIWLFKKLLPEVYNVIVKINNRLLEEIGDTPDRDRMEIIHNGEVHMARLAVYCCEHVNGVAYIHTEILKNRELKE